MSKTRDNLMNLISDKGLNSSNNQPINQEQNAGSIGDMINSERTLIRNNKIAEQINLLRDRHNARLNMAKGKVSSGNKNMDKLENARSSLADYAKSQYIKEAEKDPSIDLSILDTMKDQDIIDWMTKDDQNAKNEYLNYINKGGFVKDVYNKIMGIDEEAIKEQERKDTGWLANFGGALVSELPKQIGGIMDITGVTDYLNKKDKEKLDKYNQVSNEEYDKFKKGEVSFDKLKKKGVSGIYLDYEEDIKNGNFRGSLEDYAKAMYNKQIGETDKSIQQKMEEGLPRDYDPEGKGTGWGKFVPQMVEFAMLPGSQGSWIRNTLLGTAEILGLNTLSEGKIPTKGEAATTAGLTAIIDGMLRMPGGYKAIRSAVGRVEPEVKEALGNTTLKQWKENADVIKKGLTATKKRATEILGKAATGIKNKLSEVGDKLGEIRKGMKGNFTYKDFFYELNSSFNKFVKEGWGKGKTPQIKIKPDGTLSIRNEEALSNVTDTEGIKLLDYIKSEWNAFMKQGREGNIQDVERFMEDLNSKIWDAINNKKIDRADSGVGALLDGIKGAYEKLYSRMGPVAGPSFKKAREDFSNLDNYAKFFEKYIGKLKEGKKGTQALNELEREMQLGEKGFGKGGDYIGEFLKILKSNNIVEEDLSSQLISLIHAFGIKNPKQLKELIETVYPSIPGMREVGLELGRKGMKNAEARSMLKDAPVQSSDVRKAISNIIRPASQVGEERLMEQ